MKLVGPHRLMQVSFQSSRHLFFSGCRTRHEPVRHNAVARFFSSTRWE